MKGVILNICPHVTIVDITHEIEKYNVNNGAAILLSTIDFFPKNSIHIGIIDPGVGGNRNPIIVKTNRSLLVGPDNGLLISAAKKEGIQQIYRIDKKKYLRQKISRTFHGRDIFAPTVGYLALGVKPNALGSNIKDYVNLEVFKSKTNEGYIEALIVHVDTFGNLITNLHRHNLKLNMKENNLVNVVLKGKQMKLQYKLNYQQIENNKPALLLGSQGFFEIAMKQSSAAQSLGLSTGEKIKIIL